MSSFNVGQTTAGGTTGAYSGITGNQITLSQPGILQSVTIFWAGNSGISFLLGVYSDVSNAPGALLATSALGTTNGATQTLAMTTTPTLAPGKYWLVVQNQSNVNGHFDSGVGLGYFMGTPVWNGTLPATAPAGTTGAYTFSLYATFNTVTTLHFPMTIADTSTVTALGFEIGLRFPVTAADTSTVTALGFHGAGAILRFPLSVADSSSVTALGFHGSGTTFTVGPTSPGPSSGNYTGITASKITLAQRALLQSINVFWSVGGAGHSYLLGIYSDVSGAPGSLIASSALGTSATGLNSQSFGAGPELAAGDYWLAVQVQQPISGYFDSTTGSGAFNNSEPWTGSLPANFTVGGTGTFTFTLYATFTPSNAVHFPMAIADTSTVTALGFHGVGIHFPIVIADTSTVTALGFHQAVNAPFTVGPTAPGNSTGAYTGLTATQVTIPQTSTLQSLSIFWFSDAGNNFILGVYSDNAGAPGTLIAQSAVTVSAIGLQTVPMLTNPGMAAGTKVWLTVQTQGGIGGYYDSGGLGAFYSGQPWTGSMPATWGGGTTGAFTFSIYATLTPGAPALHFPLVVADTSFVITLGFQGAPKRFSLVVASTSTVTALGFHGVKVIVARFVKIGGSGGGTSWTDAADISIANNTANPGDIIYLAGGSYAPISFNRGGTTGNPVTIKRASASDSICTGAPGWNSSFDALVNFPAITLGAQWLTLDGNKWNPPGLPSQFGIKIATSNGQKALDMQVGNTTARNLEIVGPGFNVATTETDMIHFGPGSLISGCSLHDTDVGGFCWVGTTGSTIEYSFIYNIGTAGTHPDITYSGGGWINGTMRWNVIANIVSEGVFFDSQGAGTNILFYGNLWFQGNSRGNGCVPIEFQNNGTFGTVFMYHNTFVDWSRSNNLGQSTATVDSGSRFQNNLFVNSDSEWPIANMSFNGFYGGYASRGSNPVVGSNSPFVGPWVMGSQVPPATRVYLDSDYATMPGYDPAQYVTNFGPAAGSWVIGAGTTSVPPGMNVDMLGQTGHNLGAFQTFPAPPPALHFPLFVASTSTVTALGFHGNARFPVTIADTSTVTRLGFHIGGHFQLAVASTSTVTNLGFHVGRRFQLSIADTSTVTRLNWSFLVQHFQMLIGGKSLVITLGYENDHYHQPLTVPPYSGINQPVAPDVNPDIAWRESQPEEGPWVIPPYAAIFGPVPTPVSSETNQPGTDVVPPPISKTDLWNAMQEWPL